MVGLAQVRVSMAAAARDLEIPIGGPTLAADDALTPNPPGNDEIRW